MRQSNQHLVGLFEGLERAARDWPARVAVVDPERFLTFEQLLAAADRFTRVLVQRCKSGARIGVLLSSSADLVITYFACLRAGMLYTPLPPVPPPAMEDVLRVLSLDAVVARRPDGVPLPVIHPDARPGPCRAPLPAVDPAGPAHILLTSGTTTGVPRAVITDQLGSMHSHAWRSKIFDYHEDDVVACNIFGIWDVVPALHHGITVLMVPDATMRDPWALARALTRHAVTRIMMTPTLIAACLAAPDAVLALRRLRLVVLCGEIATGALIERARRKLPGVSIGNLYSIAECHDVAAAVVPATGSTDFDPAGFADIVVSDVDDRRRVAARGEPGRVLVAGPGLALGYVGDSDADPGFFDLAIGGAPPARHYDTGDLGILHPSGRLELLGRCDWRVKVRGRWADLQQVSAALAGHPQVVDAVVSEAGGALLARVVARRGADATPTIADLRAYLGQRLPAHCVPSRFEFVTSLALGASGKADRRAKVSKGAESAELEAEVLGVFREVLGDRAIGPDDDFVEHGGDSLSAITLLGLLQQRTGRSVAVTELYTHGTPARLARFMEGRAAPEPEWRLPVIGPLPITARPAVRVRTILITGARGCLGSALLEACATLGTFEIIALTRGDPVGGVSNVWGDLALPRLGLAEHEFRALGERIDVIVHAAALVDAFAPYSRLEPVNVGGTRELIRLAAINGAALHHVSSSAVFPLGGGRTWSEDVFGTHDIERLAAPLAASGADAYSFSKLAAESLVWRAADHGLPVRVVRIPHILGHPRRDRLLSTVDALAAAGVFPTGDWAWQFASAQYIGCVVAEGIQHLAGPVVHAAPAPLPATVILDCLRDGGADLQPVPPAAIATALDRAVDSHPGHADLRILAQLVADHGPRAALSLNDAILTGTGPCVDSSRGLFLRTLSRSLRDSETVD